MRKKIQHWKEEQKILSLLLKRIPQTAQILSLRCGYSSQKCTIILQRLINKRKIKRIKLGNKYWYTLDTY